MAILLGLVLSARPLGAVSSVEIKEVRVKPATFLPSLGGKVEYSIRVTASGTLTASMLDRDGFVVRTLTSRKRVKAGPLQLIWDGRDDKGNVVPDEAYSALLELETPRGKATYFPANRFGEMFEVTPLSYSRQDAAVVFELPRPSRVHMQAGQAVLDEGLGRNVGPVLKTILNREPRPAGRVVATWNGLDESGRLLVPSLPHFVIGIACTPLPENSVIATGNRDRAFVDYVGLRRGVSRITTVRKEKNHHVGLATEDDFSPSLEVSVRGGTKTPDGCWAVPGTDVTLALAVKAPSWSRFSSHPGKVLVFNGVLPVREVRAEGASKGVQISVPEVRSEPTVLAVNWTSDYGPTALGSICIAGTEPAESDRKDDRK